MQRVVLEKSEKPTSQSLEFRISKFQRERTEASIIYEVKSVRAIFDPDLAGGNGGYRCPPGTQNAGRWTDKFGRNCGIGVARRIGNAIGKIGGVDPAPARAVAAENRAQKLDERARKLEERAAGIVRKPATPVASRLPEPGVGRADARKERKIRRLEEAAARQEAAVQRLRPVEKEPEAPAKPKLVRAKPRAATPDRGKVVERRKIGVRGEGDGRGKPLPFKPESVWKGYGLDGSAERPFKDLTEGEMELLRMKVRIRRNESKTTPAQANVLREMLNKIQAEEDTRVDEAEVNVANLPPFKPGIMHGVGMGAKVRSLDINDFDKDEQAKITEYSAAVRNEIANGRDSWNDSYELQKRYDDIENQVVENQVRRDRLGDLIRSDRELRARPNLLLERQVEFTKSSNGIKLLDDERRVVRERLDILKSRDVVLSSIAEAKDSKLLVAEREKAVRRAELIMQNLVNPALRHPDTIVDINDWDAKIVKNLVQIKKDLETFKTSIAGPTDKKEIIEFGGDSLRRRQAELDSLISDLNNASVEDKADALQALQDYRDTIKAERLRLGAEEERPEAKDSNNLRRYLAIAENEAGLSVWNSGISKRLAIYDGIGDSVERPVILGDIAGIDGPRQITNSNITSKKAAITHIKNGGSLSDVPNEFWYEAVLANSSLSRSDPDSLFKRIDDDNKGAVGQTVIFVLRNQYGTPSTKGYVFKASKPEDNAGEIFSQELMIEHGFPVEQAGWDGMGRIKNGKRQKFVVLPYVANGVDVPSEIVNSKSGRSVNFDHGAFDGVEAEAIATRVHSFLHNYMLGTKDRHYQNGFTMVVNGHPVTIPIDQGWAGGITNLSLKDYGMFSLYTSRNGLAVDSSIYDDAQRYLSGDENERYAQAVVDTYDGMIERAENIMSESLEYWTNRVSIQDPSITPDQVANKVKTVYNLYDLKLAALKADRKKNLAMFMSKPLYDRLVA